MSEFVAQHLGTIKVALMVLLLVIHVYAVLYSPLLWALLIQPPIQLSIWVLIYFIIGYKLTTQETTRTDYEESTRAKWMWGVRVTYVVSVVLIYSIAVFIVHSWASILLSLQVEMLVWGIGVLLFCISPTAIHSIGRSRHWSSRAYVYVTHHEVSKSSTPVRTFALAVDRLRKKGVPEETIVQILSSFAREDTDIGTAAKDLLARFQDL
ncbi:MAG: hypothetical protein ACP6IT_07250 [Candidatus Thorarchaeota archaeon]